MVSGCAVSNKSLELSVWTGSHSGSTAMMEAACWKFGVQMLFRAVEREDRGGHVFAP